MHSHSADRARPGLETKRTEPTVEALVARAARGDATAWNALVDRFSSMIWAIARGMRLSAADAADASQTTWLRLLEHLDDIEHPERVAGWLATTVRRECLRVQQRSGRDILLGDDEQDIQPLVDEPEVDSRLLVDERDAVLWAAFEELPVRSRTLLGLLSTDPPLSYKDISAIMDMPIGSIGPTRARMLADLRERMAAKGLTAESRTG